MSEINDHITEADYNAACDVISCEGQDLYYRMRDARDKRARALRSARAWAKEHAKVPHEGLKWTNHCARLLAYGNQEPLQRVTRRALLEEAQRLTEFAASPLPGINGSGSYEMDDGYSCCGLADGHSEDREDAAKWALVNLAAARWAS